MARAAILFADGFEDIEAITIVDILRRAGVEVLITRVGDGAEVTSAHGVRMATDIAIDDLDIDSLDAVILPGGLPGATNLRDSDAVKQLLVTHANAGKLTAAICAAPIALAAAGILAGKRVTCYPGFEDQLGDATYCETNVLEDGHIFTASGPGPAMEFSLLLAARLTTMETANKIRAGMLV